jgi:hypothetical protein
MGRILIIVGGVAMSEDRTMVRMDAVLGLEHQLQRYINDKSPKGRSIYQDTRNNLMRDLEAVIRDGAGEWFTARYQRHFGEV